MANLLRGGCQQCVDHVGGGIVEADETPTGIERVICGLHVAPIQRSQTEDDLAYNVSAVGFSAAGDQTCRQPDVVSDRQRLDFPFAEQFPICFDLANLLNHPKQVAADLLGPALGLGIFLCHHPPNCDTTGRNWPLQVVDY